MAGLILDAGRQGALLDHRLLVIENGTVVTMDGARSEHHSGHVVVRRGRVEAVGDGAAPDLPGAQRFDAHGCLVTAWPGEHPSPPLPVGDPRVGGR